MTQSIWRCLLAVATMACCASTHAATPCRTFAFEVRDSTGQLLTRGTFSGRDRNHDGKLDMRELTAFTEEAPSLEPVCHDFGLAEAMREAAVKDWRDDVPEGPPRVAHPKSDLKHFEFDEQKWKRNESGAFTYATASKEIAVKGHRFLLTSVLSLRLYTIKALVDHGKTPVMCEGGGFDVQTTVTEKLNSSASGRESKISQGR